MLSFLFACGLAASTAGVPASGPAFEREVRQAIQRNFERIGAYEVEYTLTISACTTFEQTKSGVKVTPVTPARVVEVRHCLWKDDVSADCSYEEQGDNYRRRYVSYADGKFFWLDGYGGGTERKDGTGRGGQEPVFATEAGRQFWRRSQRDTYLTREGMRHPLWLVAPSRTSAGFLRRLTAEPAQYEIVPPGSQPGHRSFIDVTAGLERAPVEEKIIQGIRTVAMDLADSRYVPASFSRPPLPARPSGV